MQFWKKKESKCIILQRKKYQLLQVREERKPSDEEGPSLEIKIIIISISKQE